MSSDDLIEHIKHLKEEIYFARKSCLVHAFKSAFHLSYFLEDLYSSVLQGLKEGIDNVPTVVGELKREDLKDILKYTSRECPRMKRVSQEITDQYQKAMASTEIYRWADNPKDSFFLKGVHMGCGSVCIPYDDRMYVQRFAIGGQQNIFPIGDPVMHRSDASLHEKLCSLADDPAVVVAMPNELVSDTHTLFDFALKHYLAVYVSQK